jgi:hypothetical protein
MEMETLKYEMRGFAAEFWVGQRGSLTETTKLLERHAREAGEQQGWYAIATTIVAQAACEAILNEWALRHCARGEYLEIVRQGLVQRAEGLIERINGKMPADLGELNAHKNALCHAQPELTRSGKVGQWTLGDGAQRALAVVLALEEQFFPNAT